MADTHLDQQHQVKAGVAHADTAATAATLQALFGRWLTAAIAGVKDARRVGRWARGTELPRPQAAAALEHTLQVVELLRTRQDDAAIRSWFRNLQADLGNRSPALLIRSEPEQVMRAARTFLSLGSPERPPGVGTARPTAADEHRPPRSTPARL